MNDKRHLLNERYVLLRRPIEGGMGMVFEGFDTVLCGPVAVKRCLFDDEVLLRAFEREAQLLANLSHRSLPYCIDFFRSGQHQYLVMEYIEGPTAEDLLSASPRGLPIELVKDIARQLLDVVEYLHSECVLHRDIKTLNIKIQDGCLFLLDFGVAYGQSGEMSTVASGDLDFPCHSPHYSPPEQVDNEPPSPAGDLYSVAATLFKLLTGKALEDAKSRLKSAGKLMQPAVDADSEDFVMGIMRALSLDAKDRPQSANDMRQIMFPDKPKPPLVNVNPTATANSRKHALLLSALSMVLLSPLALLPLKGRTPDPPPVAAPQQNVGGLNRVHSKVREATRLAVESEALFAKGNLAEARKKADTAIELDPENTMARRVLGQIARHENFEQGNFDSPSLEAREHAQAIKEILENRGEPEELSVSERTDLAWADFQLAEHTADHALLQKVFNSANEVLGLDPDSVTAAMIAAEAGYELHLPTIDSDTVIDSDTGKALLGKLTSVLQARPRFPNAYIVQGNIYAAMGKYGSAQNSYLTAAKQSPRPATHYLVATALWLNPKHSEADLVSAREYLELTLAKNPKFGVANRALREVCELLEETDYRCQ